jgi:hypothetical protein
MREAMQFVREEPKAREETANERVVDVEVYHSTWPGLKAVSFKAIIK